MQSKSHLDFIDALRGLAALYVLFYHTALIPAPPLEVPIWGRDLFLNGGMGVTLFFVISAFTLKMSMHQRTDEPEAIKKFYIRRIFRILPLFYLWLGLSLVRDALLFDVRHPLGTIALNASFLFNFFPGRNEGITWASWTLGVEMLFYLVFPLIHRYTSTLWKAVTFLLGTLVMAALFERLLSLYLDITAPPYSSFLHFSIFTHLPVFAFGIVTFAVYDRWVKNDKIKAEIGYLMLAGSVFLFVALILGRLGFLFNTLYWQALMFALFTLGLSIVPAGQLVNPFTKYLGKISYSLYLNHPTIVLLLIPVYRQIYAVRMPITFQYGACIALTLAVLIVASSITYRLVEAPGMQAGSWLIRRLNSSPAQKTNEPEIR